MFMAVLSRMVFSPAGRSQFGRLIAIAPDFPIVVLKRLLGGIAPSGPGGRSAG
jgi:hypothetical protein